MKDFPLRSPHSKKNLNLITLILSKLNLNLSLNVYLIIVNFLELYAICCYLFYMEDMYYARSAIYTIHGTLFLSFCGNSEWLERELFRVKTWVVKNWPLAFEVRTPVFMLCFSKDPGCLLSKKDLLMSKDEM